MIQTFERNEFFGKLTYDLETDTINVLYDDCINKEASQKFLSAPTNVFFELTNVCNLRCSHCFNGEIKSNENLDVNEWKQIIDQISNMKVFYVKITGGEPFLYPGLFELLEYLDTVHLNYIIYTNGTYISQNLEKLVNLQHLMTIRVSLEGTKAINDNIRGDGMFDTVIDAIRLLESKGVPCSINYTINRVNYHLLSELEDYLLNECELNIPIHLGFVKHAGNSLTNKEICFFDSIEYNHVIKHLETLLENSSLIEPLYMLPEYYYEIFGDHFGCPAAQTSMVIKSNGNIVPCGLLPETDLTVCGNIKDESIVSVWNSNKMNVYRKLIPPTRCTSCEEFLSNCTGGCRANAYNISGNIQGNDINCDVYKSLLSRKKSSHV